MPTQTLGDAITELQQSVGRERVKRATRQSSRDRMLPRNVLLVLFLVPTAVSLLRLFRIMITTSSPSPTSPFFPQPTPTDLPLSDCPPPVAVAARPFALTSLAILGNGSMSSAAENLAPKEIRLLSNVVSRRAPCNLLFFGFRPQLLALSGGLNAGGRTVFLEDGAHNLRAAPTGSQSVQVYEVKYNATAGMAYDLLRRARADPACVAPWARGGLRSSLCPLALSWLPTEVNDRPREVVVVDGPSGDRPEAPGRMAAIYSAGVMARAGKVTDVLVHDVDRTVERWFAWEYLCHENLASSKGKLWHFRIRGNSTSPVFCSESKVAIM